MQDLMGFIAICWQDWTFDLFRFCGLESCVTSLLWYC